MMKEVLANAKPLVRLRDDDCSYPANAPRRQEGDRAGVGQLCRDETDNSLRSYRDEHGAVNLIDARGPEGSVSLSAGRGSEDVWRTPIVLCCNFIGKGTNVR